MMSVFYKKPIWFPAVNIWKEEPSNMDVLVEGNRLASIGGMFHEREIPYTVAIADVNAILEFQQASLAKAFCKSKLVLIVVQ